MRFVLLLSVVGAMIVGGCASSDPPQDRSTSSTPLAPYRLNSGDRLRIVVFGQADLSNTYVIDQAGSISMPLIGDVAARGRTTQALEGEIVDKFTSGRFLRDPDISVEVDRDRPVFILGEVNSAGQYPSVAGMTAQTAVAIAGGFTPCAVARATGTPGIGGRQQAAPAVTECLCLSAPDRGGLAVPATF